MPLRRRCSCRCEEVQEPGALRVAEELATNISPPNFAFCAARGCLKSNSTGSRASGSTSRPPNTRRSAAAGCVDAAAGGTTTVKEDAAGGRWIWARCRRVLGPQRGRVRPDRPAPGRPRLTRWLPRWSSPHRKRHAIAWRCARRSPLTRSGPSDSPESMRGYGVCPQRPRPHPTDRSEEPENSNFTRYGYGRREPKCSAALRLGLYVTDVLPDSPASVDGDHHFQNWQMLGNDRWVTAALTAQVAYPR